MALSTFSAVSQPSFHIHEDDLMLFVSGDVDKERFATIATHIDEPPVPQDERRQEHRIRTNDPGLLRMLDPLVSKLIAVRLIDVSKNGAKLQTPVAMPIGGLVQVQVGQSVIFGEVRYSVADCGKIYSGIRIQGLHQFSDYRPPSRDQCLSEDILYAYIRGEVGEDGVVAKDHLMHCCSCRDRLAMAIQEVFEKSERCLEDRHLKQNDSVLLRTLDPFGLQLWEAGVIEVAGSEVTLRTSIAIPPGAIVHLLVHDKLLILGRIKRCESPDLRATVVTVGILETFTKA
ncbi:MAG: hypothetical protein WDO18_17085 [Acidobacteriota bacterium]